MSGKPFQSQLEPHYELIREARRNRQTWQTIVELLAGKGITTSRPAVYSFMKRRRKRRYILGVISGDVRCHSLFRRHQISRITGIINGLRLVLFWIYRFRSFRTFSFITP